MSRVHEESACVRVCAGVCALGHATSRLRWPSIGTLSLLSLSVMLTMSTRLMPASAALQRLCGSHAPHTCILSGFVTRHRAKGAFYYSQGCSIG